MCSPKCEINLEIWRGLWPQILSCHPAVSGTNIKREKYYKKNKIIKLLEENFEKNILVIFCSTESGQHGGLVLLKNLKYFKLISVIRSE